MAFLKISLQCFKYENLTFLQVLEICNLVFASQVCKSCHKLHPPNPLEVQPPKPKYSKIVKHDSLTII